MSLKSYFSPTTIYQDKSIDNSNIEVKEISGRKRLFIGGYPQSSIDYERCWKNILKRINLSTIPESAEILVLGLGGGDLARVIDKLRPSWNITFVEIEPKVIYVAKKYFQIDDTPKRKIVEGDAKLFLATTKQKYDLVVVDIYDGDDVPRFVSSEVFLKNILRVVKNRGMALFNYASHSFHEREFDEFRKKLLKYFSSAQILKRFAHSYFLAR